MKKLILSLVGSVSLIACGGGGGGESEPTAANNDNGQPLNGLTQTEQIEFFDAAKKGTFIDSAVEGLSYQTPSFEGITDADGGYQSKPGETIRFFLKRDQNSAELELGEIFDNNGVATPIEFESFDSIARQTNILILLQTLDTDMDADNGITINQSMLPNGYEEINFLASTKDFQTQLQNLGLTPVSEERAINHMKKTIDAQISKGNPVVVNIKNTVWKNISRFPLQCKRTDAEGNATFPPVVKVSEGSLVWGERDGKFTIGGDWKQNEETGECEQRPSETFPVEFTATNGVIFFDCASNGDCRAYDLNKVQYLEANDRQNDCNNNGRPIDCVITKSYDKAKSELTVKTDFLNGFYVYDIFRLDRKLSFTSKTFYVRNKVDGCMTEDRSLLTFNENNVVIKSVDGANLTETGSDCKVLDLGVSEETFSYDKVNAEVWPCDPRECELSEMTSSSKVNGDQFSYRYERRGVGFDSGSLYLTKDTGDGVRVNRVYNEIKQFKGASISAEIGKG